MDFITRYYKTLSENLQAKKENLLLEVRRRQAGTPVATASQFLNPGMFPQIPQQAVPISQQTTTVPTPLNPARLPGMGWAKLSPQQNFSPMPQQTTAVPGVNTFGPPSPAVPGVNTFGPPSPAVPGVNTFGPPSPAVPGVDTFGPPSPAVPGVDTFGPFSPAVPGVDTFGPPSPTGQVTPVVPLAQTPSSSLSNIPGMGWVPQPTVSPQPSWVSPSSPPSSAAPTTAPAPAPFAGRGPMMSKKDQASYDKMVGDMMKARGMPVPMLRTGKGGNYQEWRSAVDARNAAMRDANIAITLRQNQLRDQQTLARQNRDAAKAAGDDAAVARYQQELNDINRSRGNLNKDTGRYSLGSDTTSQGRIANDQLQASWKKKQEDFKARTGMDYDPSNPQHTRVMQNPNMSPEAMQTALSVGQFNKNYATQNADQAKRMGETERNIDQLTYETERAKNDPAFRKEINARDAEKAKQDMYAAAGGKEAWEARENAARDGQVKIVTDIIDAKKAESDEMNRKAREIGGMMTKAEFEASPAGQQAELDRLRNLSGVPQMQAKRAAEQREKDKETLATNYPALNMVGDAIRQTKNLPTTQPEQSQQTPAETLPEPSVNMTGNNISRARANSANTTPIQRATVTPPAPGAIPPAGRPTPAAQPTAPMSTGGMNTPADINDPQANARRPRGRVVTAAARSMGPNSSAPRLS